MYFQDKVMKFTLKSGPHGDCTCWYDIEVPKGWTLRDFITYAVHTYASEHREWGCIRKVPFEGYRDHIVEYDGRQGKNGMAWLYKGKQYMTPDDKSELLENSTMLYNKYIDREIVSVRANGGWGTMDYYLDFGPEPISYANYEI
jgi:hypothetical protein